MLVLCVGSDGGGLECEGVVSGVLAPAFPYVDDSELCTHAEAVGLTFVDAEARSPGELRIESMLKLFNPRKPEFSPSTKTPVSDTDLCGCLKVRVFLLPKVCVSIAMTIKFLQNYTCL